jgi:hypothetical protein
VNRKALLARLKKYTPLLIALVIALVFAVAELIIERGVY